VDLNLVDINLTKLYFSRGTRNPTSLYLQSYGRFPKTFKLFCNSREFINSLQLLRGDGARFDSGNIYIALQRVH